MSSQASNEATTGDSIKTSYKEQLDKAAEKAKGPPAGTKVDEEPSTTLLDKGTLTCDTQTRSTFLMSDSNRVRPSSRNVARQGGEEG